MHRAGGTAAAWADPYAPERAPDASPSIQGIRTFPCAGWAQVNHGLDLVMYGALLYKPCVLADGVTLAFQARYVLLEAAWNASITTPTNSIQVQIQVHGAGDAFHASPWYTVTNGHLRITLDPDDLPEGVLTNRTEAMFRSIQGAAYHFEGTVALTFSDHAFPDDASFL